MKKLICFSLSCLLTLLLFPITQCQLAFATAKYDGQNISKIIEKHNEITNKTQLFEIAKYKGNSNIKILKKDANTGDITSVSQLLCKYNDLNGNEVEEISVTSLETLEIPVSTTDAQVQIRSFNSNKNLLSKSLNKKILGSVVIDEDDWDKTSSVNLAITATYTTTKSNSKTYVALKKVVVDTDIDDSSVKIKTGYVTLGQSGMGTDLKYKSQSKKYSFANKTYTPPSSWVKVTKYTNYDFACGAYANITLQRNSSTWKLDVDANYPG